MTVLERLKAALSKSKFHVPDFNDDNYVCEVGSADLHKLIAVVEAAENAVGFVDDPQLRKALRYALSELDKP